MGRGVNGGPASAGPSQIFVFGITTADPLTYLSAALTFLVVAIAAIVIPARRASRVDPITALHLE